jgi:hypothetical protein
MTWYCTDTGNLHEDVVFRLRLNVQSKLLHAQVNPSGDLVEPWQFEVYSGIANTQKFSHALYYDSFRRPDLEEAAEDCAQQKDASDSVKDESERL